MSTTTATLGACPHCGVSISKTNLIIEYETTDGSDIYAECPSCLDVVTPE